MEISSRESFVLTPGGRKKVVGEAKAKIIQQKHRKWGTEQRNIKMLRSMTKKKTKNKKVEKHKNTYDSCRHGQLWVTQNTCRTKCKHVFKLRDVNNSLTTRLVKKGFQNDKKARTILTMLVLPVVANLALEKMEK